MLNDDTRIVPLTLLAQAGVTVCLALGAALFGDAVVASSVLLGGLVAVIPNGFLAARLLSPRAATARALLRAAWIGEIGKLLLTALLFGVVFATVRPLSAPAVFVAFIAAQLALVTTAVIGGMADAHNDGKSVSNGR